VRLRDELAILLLLVLLAAPPRLLGLDSLPPGLFHDEAYEGIDGRRILMGARPVFLAENYGREPLYAYVVAGLIALGGPTAASVRAASALFGVLLVPASYLWGRTFFGGLIGLTVAALSTVTYWTLQESRLGMRPIALPVFLALSSALIWLAARRGRFWAWPLAGLSLGLSFYTYLPVRLFPLVLLAQLVLGARARWREVGPPGWRLAAGLGLYLAGVALLALPLALYFRGNPDDATARSAVVSIFASDEWRANPLGTLGRNVVLNLAMFTWRGDDTVRHNLPFRPVFDPLLSAFLLIGVALSVRRVRQPAWLATWGWLGFMTVPGILSDSAPHFLRSIGLLPALFALPALGLTFAARRVGDLLAGRWTVGRANALGAAGVALVLGASQLLTWHDYFLELPRQAGLAEAFDAPRADLARLAGDPPPGTPLELPTPGWSYATIRFLRAHSFVEPHPAQPVQARFANNAELLGYDLEPAQPWAGQPARLTLAWRALREMPASYVEAARVLDGYGRVWWQHEGFPGLGTLPTDTWLQGEFVADHLTLELTPGTPAGEYVLEITLSQPDGGRRLAVLDAGGHQIGTSLRLPGLRVAAGAG
jgi:4-amino-4-deoxy-L-arabinose transferase-like glycosyltransferase